MKLTWFVMMVVVLVVSEVSSSYTHDNDVWDSDSSDDGEHWEDGGPNEWNDEDENDADSSNEAQDSDEEEEQSASDDDDDMEHGIGEGEVEVDESSDLEDADEEEHEGGLPPMTPPEMPVIENPVPEQSEASTPNEFIHVDDTHVDASQLLGDLKDKVFSAMNSEGFVQETAHDLVGSFERLVHKLQAPTPPPSTSTVIPIDTAAAASPVPAVQFGVVAPHVIDHWSRTLRHGLKLITSEAREARDGAVSELSRRMHLLPSLYVHEAEPMVGQTQDLDTSTLPIHILYDLGTNEIGWFAPHVRSTQPKQPEIASPPAAADAGKSQTEAVPEPALDAQDGTPATHLLAPGQLYTTSGEGSLAFKLLAAGDGVSVSADHDGKPVVHGIKTSSVALPSTTLRSNYKFLKGTGRIMVDKLLHRIWKLNKAPAHQIRAALLSILSYFHRSPVAKAAHVPTGPLIVREFVHS